MKKSLNIILIIILATFLFTGCEKKGDPPALPPAESMEIDFSDFIAGTKSATIATDSKGASSVNNTNWTVAATVAGVWNSILVLNLAVPVASFRLAVNNKPEYLDNKTWQWKYTAQVVGATYTARLTGQIRSTDVKWDMYITREGAGGFAEFKWFEGTTNLDGKSGQWILVQSQAQQVPMLQIDWTKDGSTVGSVKYTYIGSGSFQNSYIEYGLTANSLDAYYNVHFYETNRAKFVDVNIEWSTTGHNGRVKAADYFLDSIWHCWDAGGNDITCPN
jgi:hypothetical protein